MKLLNILTTAVLSTFTQAESLPEYHPDLFHAGSITAMNKIIDTQEKIILALQEPGIQSQEQAINLLLVSKLVNIYPNKEEQKKKIIACILICAKESNVDVITLTALLAKESSLNQNAKHSTVFVKIPTAKNWTSYKTARVNAVGMGGVIFEIWKYELKEIGINSRDALLNVENNIKAAAHILGIYTHERKQLKHTSSKEESALLRYYGVIRNHKGIPNKTYSTQIYKIKNSIEI